MPPGVVSHYEVLEPLGQGGMGVVHKGRDLRLDRLVALKFLSAERLASERDRERFHREARALSALNHPHIATVYEMGESEGVPFLAMEYLPGGTLRQRLSTARGEKRELPFAALLTWGIGLAEALEHAHAHGIVHRDVKSSNAMFDGEGRIKLTDFGLARAHGGADRTGSGGVAGTVGYMSPEQLRGVGGDPRSDLYALGVVLYESATAELPFRADSPAETIEKILHATPEPPGHIRGDIPAEFDRIVGRLMARDPGARYQDASGLLRDLRAMDTGTLYEPPTATVTTGPVRRTHGRLVGASALTTLAALGAGAYLLLHAPRPDRKQLAVLPVRCIGAGPDEQAFCDGLTETITSSLSQVGALSVVAASETRRLETADQARSELGVNLVVYASLQRQGDDARLSLSLVDTETKRALGSETVRGPVARLYELEDGVLAKLADLIGVSVPSAEGAILASAGTGSPGAFEAYVRGRGLLCRFDREGNLDRALAQFEEAARLDPSLSLAYEGIAEARLRAFRAREDPRDLEAARAAAQRALALSPDLPSAQVVLGAVLVESGREQEGRERLEAALRLDPSNAAVYREIATLFTSDKRYDEAEQTYRRAILARPRDWMTHAELAKFFFDLQRFPEAAAEYRKVVELEPDNHFGYRNLGGVLLAMEDYQGAETMLRKAQALHPTARALSNLGTAYMFENRYREAVEVLDQAATLAESEAPTEYRIWGNLGDARWLAGEERERAHAAWRRAAQIAEERLARRPNNADLESVLAEYYAKLDDRGRALERIDAALRDAPESASVHYQAGVVRAILTDLEGALAELRRALALGDVAAQIRQAPELRALRASPQFKSLNLPGEERR